jgi:hypothetical protein
MLYNALTNEGFRPEIAEGYGHWFVKCGDFLVDVTASQFGQGMVCVRDWNRTQKKAESGHYSMGWWRCIKLHKNPGAGGLQIEAENIDKALDASVK